MKSLLVPAFALVASAFASPRAHGHMHFHEKRNHLEKRDIVEEKVSVTVIECWLGDHMIPEEECNNGIKNGTLKWADDGSLIAAATSTAILTSSLSSPSTSAAASSTKAAPVLSSSSPSPSPSPSPVAAPAPVQAASNSGSSSSGSGVNTDFPDGQLDCSNFPSDYGAVAVDWLNLGGWSGVQKPNQQSAAGYSDIMTVTRSQCDGGNCCIEGSYCSYACPDGYLKWQWPADQGATGQSVGGLYCNGGKLHLSNPTVRTLCAPGASNINVSVVNKMSQNVAICRTNYPGDEKMSIPTDSQPGTTKQLACPDASTFYQWQGKGTSAQYYINMPGYSVEKACVWGNPGDNFGNYAPGNLGVGWSGGRAWLSIQANHPTQMTATLPYTIEIIGGNTKCRYQNGQYCGGDNYQTCSTEGCTVSSAGGDISYVLSD